MLVYRELKDRVSVGDWVLDIGTKDGNYVADLDGRVIAIDIDIEPVEYTVEYVIADGRRLPFRGGSFDYIVCNQVLEHIREKGAVLDEIHRLLAPEGVVLLSIPNRLFPMNPHQLPTCFSLLPRWIVLRIGKIALSKDQLDYYESSVFNTSPFQMRRLLHARFEEVQYVTHRLVEQNADLFEEGLAGRALIFALSTMGWAIETLPGRLIFELFYGYSSYICSMPKQGGSRRYG